MTYMRKAGSLGAVLALAGIAACGLRSSEPPGPGYESGLVPDFRGQRVIVLPFQLRAGGHPDVDHELLFALRGAPVSVDWVGPDELRDALARSPGMGIRLDGLDVHQFLVAEVQRVGDPLFGDLYRLGGLVDARYAVLPVEIRARAENDGSRRVMEVRTAVLEVRTGRVLWYGVLEGPPGSPGGLEATVGAVEALARRLVP